MPDHDTQTTRSNPFVFVVGCPRSGTTLLQRMLDNHPQLTVANDTHFITRSVKRVLRKDPQPLLTNEMVQLVLSYRRFYRMGLSEQEVIRAADNCETYAEFVSRLYTLRGEKKHKRFSGEKTPDYCRNLPLLHTLFPDARFVHIIRDGRNTALSTLDWATATKGPGRWSLWATDPVGTCALWWRWQAGMGQRDGNTLGKARFHQVKYEDLVAQPENELGTIAGFLGIDDSAAMANYHAGKTLRQPGLSAKKAWLPPVKNLRDWRTAMTPEDVGVFEGIAGPLLRSNAYECMDYPASKAVLDRVSRCLDWWQTEGRG